MPFLPIDEEDKRSHMLSTRISPRLRAALEREAKKRKMFASHIVVELLEKHLAERGELHAEPSVFG